MSSDKRTEAGRWFHQAVYDLKAGQWNMEGGFHNTACFLAQQAGEKALKSLLYYQGARRKALMTHSLVEMVREGAKVLNTLANLMEEARNLDLHYIPSRYPNGLPGGYPHQFYGKEMAEKALISSGKIITDIEDYYRTQGEEEILSPDEE